MYPILLVILAHSQNNLREKSIYMWGRPPLALVSRVRILQKRVCPQWQSSFHQFRLHQS